MYSIDSSDCSTFDLQVMRDTLDKRKPAYNNTMTFHCERCNTVWADSLGVCGEAKCFDSLICINVTQDVIVKNELESRVQGEMKNCVYNSLICAGCSCAVGVVLHSTPAHLACLRSLFLMQKDKINCYVLSKGSMVKASTLNFDLKPIDRSIAKLKLEMEAHLEHVSLLHGRLMERSSMS